MRIILGSESPRRKEILSYFNIPFDQISPGFSEQSIPFHGDVKKYVCEISDGKAAALHHRFSHAIIVTADTIVFHNGKIYGKPTNAEEAFKFLKALSGTWHQVITGVTVQRGDEIYHQAEETRVLFNQLTDQEIHSYQKSLNVYDKAGGYAIQMGGGLIVKRIEGCYYNVMGMPINTLRKLLLHVGIDLWNHLQIK